ncbi:hypothetical protein H2199_006494 [Coniosporium tulheliwenetii]|uniref:Uncharacterized protein n=1 Tax=Coniosporium tulheliwenetii TaxID=3383036 RepID=A0ACC2YWK4_9PEZI|nr:hypothetical protein H2199_006494 [Cladosporium sp. JES 115]
MATSPWPKVRLELLAIEARFAAARQDTIMAMLVDVRKGKNDKEGIAAGEGADLSDDEKTEERANGGTEKPEDDYNGGSDGGEDYEK